MAGPHQVAITDVPEPVSEDGAVLTVTAAGVCAADRMMFDGSGPWDVSFPVVPGHEIVGVVESIADASSRRWGVGVGDRAAVEVKVPCGTCRACTAGDTHLCPHGQHLGSDLPGAMAERIAIPPAARVWPLNGVTDAAAGIVEPVACAVHAVRRLDPAPSQVVLVTGAGAVGCAAMAVAIGRGADVVAVVRSAERAAVATGVGARPIIAPTDDAAAIIREQVGQVDGVIECTGATAVVPVALDVVRPGGRIVLYGVYRRPAEIDLNLIAEHKELEVHGGHLAPHGAFGEAIRLLADGTVDGSRLITHRHPLDDVLTALEPAAGPVRVKAILEPNR